MQKTRIIHFNSKNSIQFLRQGYPLLIMFVCYIIGITLGAVLIRSHSDIARYAADSYADWFSTNSGFWENACHYFLDWLPTLLLIFIFGTCIVGVAVIPAFVLLKGLEYGIMAGYFYTNFSLNGIVCVLILIIPPTIIAAFIMFLTAECSFYFSLRLAKHSLPEPRAELIYPYLIKFCKKFLIFVASIFLAAMLHSLLSAAFADVIKNM